MGNVRLRGAGRWVACALWAVAAPGLRAAEDLDREFAFASGLIDLGFPDFAARLVEQLVRQHPAEAERAKLTRAEILIAQRKFAEAEDLLKGMPAESPKTQAARLAVANGYYRAGEIEKAREIYKSFFAQYGEKAPDDPDLKRFIMDSAYRFGQMLETAGDLAGAASAYGRVLACKPDVNIARRMQAEISELWVRAAQKETDAAKRTEHLQKARKLCEAVQWGGIDLWFGRTVATLANIELAKGNKAAAQKVLRDNLDILRQIDDLLKKEDLPLSQSPMAAARFMLGSLFDEEGDGLLKGGKNDEAIARYAAALTEFYNVFAKYGESDWGPDAGMRAEDVKDKLVKLGKTPKVDLGRYQDAAVAAQFKLADSLFLQKQFAPASESYLKILNRFPEGAAVARPLMNLLLSFCELKDALAVRATSRYIAERFAANPDAGLALLAGGKFYYDAGDLATYRSMYDQFADAYPKHEKTPAILYALAGIARQAKDEAASRAYLARIVAGFPNDAYYLKALNQQGWSEYSAKRYEEAATTFGKVVAESPPGHPRAVGQYLLADAQMRLGRHADALKGYRQLQTWLTPPEDRAYGQTGEEIAKNKDMLEKSSFHIGYALAKIAEPAEQVPQLRAAAVQVFGQFVARYPASELASRAMNMVGTVQLELGQTDAAAATFQELQAKFPASEEGKSARYALVRAALEIKKFEVALEAFEKMKAESSKYSPDQFVRVAQSFYDAQRYAEAAAAFEFVRGSGTDERAVLELALYGLGRSYYELREYEKAVGVLDQLLVKYPNSGLFYDAKFMLGRSNREMGKLPEAMAALGDVFKYSTNAVRNNQASLDLAGIQEGLGAAAEKAGKAEEARQAFDQALASFQRVALLADLENAELRPLVEESLYRAVPLFLKVGRFAEAVDACDQYLKAFTKGPRVEDVQKWRAEARLRASAAPAAAPAPPRPGTGTGGAAAP